MNIADKLRKNSKLANSEKAKRSLAKTLAEKRKKAKLLAIKKAEEIAALEKKRAKERTEKAKQAVEAENLKIIKNYLEKFYKAAWNGESYFIASESDGDNNKLLKPYGLMLLSTEEFAESLNNSLNDINDSIGELNSHLSKIGIRTSGLIPGCSPKDISSNEYNFLQRWAVTQKLINQIEVNISKKIESLELSHATTSSSIRQSKNAAKFLAERLKTLAESFSKDTISAFKNNYQTVLHRPPASILENMPELKRLTYAERIDNRDYQFRIARQVFSDLGLHLPSPEELQVFNGSQPSQSYPFGEVDTVGRYIAFFRILCGGEPYSTISKVVREEIISNNSADLAIEEKRLRKIELLIESEKHNLNDLNKNTMNKEAAKINKKIESLKNRVNETIPSTPYSHHIFKSQYMFDLDALRINQLGNNSFNLLIEEILWLLSNVGILNVGKLMNALESASTKGLRTLQLSYEELDGKIHFQKNGKRLFELKITLENFLKMLEKDKLSYTLKAAKSSNVLTIKWL